MPFYTASDRRVLGVPRSESLTFHAMQTVMLVSNLHAGSVSARTREVIVKALKADFKLEVVDTQHRNHATELANDAVDRGFDAVLAFGGDGTINEAVQALIGTDVALGILPGGSTNVMARSLGIPVDAVEATSFVASRLHGRSPRKIKAGKVDERYFLFSVGMGLDAEVVRRVEADPEKKREHGEWWFLSNTFRAGLGDYRGLPATIRMSVDGGEGQHVMTVVCCNGRPFTYFKRYPVDVCPGTSLDGGLDVFGLRKLRATTAVRLVWSLFVSRSHTRWRNTYYHHDISTLEIEADRPFPMQVDGDYIGERQAGSVSLVPDAVGILV